MPTAIKLHARSVLRLVWFLTFSFFAAALFTPSSLAHTLNLTRLSVTVVDHSAELRIEADLALLLGGPDAYDQLIQSPAEIQAARLPSLAAELLADIPATFTPASAPWRFVSGELPAVRDADANPDDLGVTTFVFQTQLPGEGDHAITFSSRPLVRIEFPVACSLVLPATENTVTRWLESPGSSLPPLPVPASALQIAATPPPPPGSETPASPADPRDFRSDAPWPATVWQYLRLGFRHILPLGLDHILFVLGLYFLGAGWRALAAQIACFTLAHTTTLGLAAYGIVNVPAAVVEPLIALSIAFVALENIFRPRLGAGRLVVVSLFGLLHGLGFAGSLSDVPMPRDQFFTALLSFNFGVDFGQLAVLAAAFLTAGWFRNRSWYRRAVAIPACAAIAATGLFWTVQRSLF